MRYSDRLKRLKKVVHPKGEEDTSDTGIRDTDTGKPIDWGEIFFRLHHYCNLDKWTIKQYTLPQITELMRQTNKHIQFEVTLGTAGLGGMFGGVPQAGDTSEKTESEDDYVVLDEEGFNLLSQALGGG
jgi:hypothetical protein